MIWKFILYAVVGYVVLLLLVFLLQRRMLYYPDSTRLTGEYAHKAGLRSWPSSENHRGYVSENKKGDNSGTVVVFHGNAGAACHRGYYAAALNRLGLRVILAEYPGYGGRSGTPSEKVFVADALETIQLVHGEYGDPLYLWGESLGAGVVAAVIKKSAISIKGAVLLTPWDSLPSVAQTHYWYFPTRYLVREQYNNIANLNDYHGNVAVVLAGNDNVVPPKHGQKLYDSITTQKQLWHFAQAGHNTMPMEPHLSWWQDVIEFISK
jgi:alpha-beta hydrolase superfamily lysophospholipase